jgi:hypothetical protein
VTATEALRAAADELADLPYDTSVQITRDRAQALLIYMANRAEEDADG